MTPDHAMYLGAITQTVVAAQVMQLVERGQVDRDSSGAIEKAELAAVQQMLFQRRRQAEQQQQQQAASPGGRR